MSKNEKWEADIAQKNAARTLLKQYIVEHPEDICLQSKNLSRSSAIVAIQDYRAQ